MDSIYVIDTSILTTILDAFVKTFEKGWVLLFSIIEWLSGTLIAIELIMLGFVVGFEGGRTVCELDEKADVPARLGLGSY